LTKPRLVVSGGFRLQLVFVEAGLKVGLYTNTREFQAELVFPREQFVTGMGSSAVIQ